MKSVFASIVTLSFIAIAVCGIFVIGQMSAEERRGCLAATSQGVACEEGNNPLAFISFHLNTFKSFSTAVLNQNTASHLLVLLTLFTLSLGIIIFRMGVMPVSVQAELCVKKQKSTLLKQVLTGWLGLHEKRADASIL